MTIKDFKTPRRGLIALISTALALTGVVLSPASADPVLNLSPSSISFVQCTAPGVPLQSVGVQASIGGSGPNTGTSSHITVDGVPAGLNWSASPTVTGWLVTFSGCPTGSSTPIYVTISARADADPPRTISATLTINVTVAHTVTFNANGGTGVMMAQVSAVPAALAANQFLRSGYTFAGWNTAANGSGTSYANLATYAFAADLTLYAQWNAVPGPTVYTVSFNANGGTGTMLAQSSSSAAALTLNAFTRLGYSFAGWNTLANGTGTAYANGATYPFSSSTTLYAQWTALSSFTVIFDPNGGTGTMAPLTANVPTALTLNSYTRVGWKFNGWNTAANGSGTAYANGATYGFAAGATLYAQWKPMRAAKTAKVLFADLSTVLTKEGKARLTAIARYFGKAVVKVTVVGYVRKAGSNANNYTLSTARANVVANYLKSLGLGGTYIVRGDGVAPERGAPGRKVIVTAKLLP